MRLGRSGGGELWTSAVVVNFRVFVFSFKMSDRRPAKRVRASGGGTRSAEELTTLIREMGEAPQISPELADEISKRQEGTCCPPFYERPQALFKIYGKLARPVARGHRGGHLPY